MPMISIPLKDIALAPIYWVQGRKIKRTALLLPEAKGARQGMVTLPKPSESSNLSKQRDTKLTIMLVGDSAAAGVGAATQKDALIGYLIDKLQVNPILINKRERIEWSVHATSGHTSFDTLRRLYILPKPSTPIDLMIVSVGVNDTVKNTSLSQWRSNLEGIITIAQRKFKVQTLIFSGLPPMAHMIALPSPLNSYIGSKADILDTILQEVCQSHDHVHYYFMDFANTMLSAEQIFATDGFHPSSLAYDSWADALSEKVADLV